MVLLSEIKYTNWIKVGCTCALRDLWFYFQRSMVLLSEIYGFTFRDLWFYFQRSMILFGSKLAALGCTFFAYHRGGTELQLW